MKDRKVEVSIIIPIYKIKEEYLKKCVDSFEKQTFKNIELILVDDGSPDNCGKVCDDLAIKYLNITVIHQKNQGVSHARNNGMNHALGKWIMFADPDDYVEKDLIETLIQYTTRDTDIICCACKVLLDNQKLEINYFFPKNLTFNCNEEKMALYLQLMKSKYNQPGKAYTAIGVPWGKLYRKSFLTKNNLKFDPKLRRMQDNIFNMYAFYYARNIKYINQSLYIYRYEHIGQYYREYNPNHVKNNFNIIQKRKECLEKTGLIKNQILYNYYLLEAFQKLKIILRYGPFHTKNNYGFANQIKEAKKIKDDVQDILFNIKKNHVLERNIDKIMCFMICNEHWLILKTIWKFRK